MKKLQVKILVNQILTSSKWSQIRKIKFVVAGMLVFAILKLPYFYYMILRIVVCSVSGIIIYNLYKDRDFLEVSPAKGTHEHKEYQKKQKAKRDANRLIAVAGVTIPDRDNKGWGIAFGIIFLLFNPIVPVYFDRAIWFFIDIATAGIFIASGLSDTE